MDKRKLISIAKIIGRVVLALVCLYIIGVVYWVYYILPNHKIGGAEQPLSPFAFDDSLWIEKTTANGTPYKVNNSECVYYLDVCSSDEYCDKVFKNYADAIAYCRTNELPVIPSVQLVQGKCKQFNDGLCTALETETQTGGVIKNGLSKQDALTKLLSRLLEQRDLKTAYDSDALDKAIVHIATALSLSDAEPLVPPDLQNSVNKVKAGFLSNPVYSKPAGFWNQTSELHGIFRQDRYLSGGFDLASSLPVVIVLSQTINADPELSEAFSRFRKFDSAICNPPVYIRTDVAFAEPAACLSFLDVMAVLPSEIDSRSKLTDENKSKILNAVESRFGKGSGFALVSYSESKEYEILAAAKASSMEIIIDAVRSGSISLEPEKDSGWYDYQWHALETLLCPDRAREAGKLKLSGKYRKRLEDAFKTSLTKDRDTHIKHIPVITQGISDKMPEEIVVVPEFCVEPTATVYLRYARGYRFLRTVLKSILGDDYLPSVRRTGNDGKPSPVDLDSELRRMELVCYGLYGRLCYDIGLAPLYLADEMTDEKIADARQAADDWLMNYSADIDMAADTRYAVPIAWDDGIVEYWSTCGVKLQRVRYEFELEPEVTGGVEPKFKPAFYYLPTDIYMDISTSIDALMTREDFRTRCDKYSTETELRKAFGIESPSDFRLVYWLKWTAIIGVASAGLFYYIRRKPETRKRIRRWTMAAAGAFIGIWILILIVSPRYRAQFVIRHIGTINPNMGVFVENWAYRHVSRKMILGVIDLLLDPDPQVRYVAARCLNHYDINEELIKKDPKNKDIFLQASNDEIDEVAFSAILCLSIYREPDVVAYLTELLKTRYNNNSVCLSIICSLGQINDPRSFELFESFTVDPRPLIRRRAILSIGKYKNDPRTCDVLLRLMLDDDPLTCEEAFYAIDSNHLYTEKDSNDPRFDSTFLIAAKNTRCDMDIRLGFARGIKEKEKRQEAAVAICLTPSDGDNDGWSMTSGFRSALYMLRPDEPNPEDISSIERLLLSHPTPKGVSLRRAVFRLIVDERNPDVPTIETFWTAADGDDADGRVVALCALDYIWGNDECRDPRSKDERLGLAARRMNDPDPRVRAVAAEIHSDLTR